MDYVEEEPEDSSNIFTSGISLLETYGWYLLIVFVILAYIYHRTLKSYLEKYKEYKFEKEYSAKYHKNPDLFAERVNAQQRWTEKLQEQYNKESEEYLKKQKEKEEKKKQELIAKYGGADGFVLGSTNDENKKNGNFRPEYNPLMGAGSSSNYRPPRRSPCGSGGCG